MLNIKKKWDGDKTEHSIAEAISIVEAMVTQYSNDIDTKRNENESKKTALASDVREYTENVNAQMKKDIEKSKEVIEQSTVQKENVKNRVIKIDRILDTIKADLDVSMGQDLQKAWTLKNKMVSNIKTFTEVNREFATATEKKLREETRINLVEKVKENSEEKNDASSKYAEYLSSEKLKNQSLISNVISPKAIENFTELVRAESPSAENFSCTEFLSKFLHLGRIRKEIPVLSFEETSEVFAEGEFGICQKKGNNKLEFSLPYGQTLDEGISLFVEYTQNDRHRAHEIIKKLVLKTFMSFPAGKVEATMIDPLELGETFSLFSKLGEETNMPRIIDEKIWSQEGDITRVINAFRGKIENLTQSYGDNREARLKKEPVRVLAITDFPTGFSANAIKDLEAIVRKATASGVCIFIAANSNEIAKLKEGEQRIYNEIKEMLHVGTLMKDEIKADLYDEVKDVYIAIDSVSDDENVIRQIIQMLSKAISMSKGKLEKFTDMFEDVEDPNHWYEGDISKGIQIPIGIKGADNIVKLTMGKQDGSTEHHALITGQTGAGKTNLLHTIIMSTMLSYKYDEVQMYLVDFKEGVEFNTYIKYRLPYFRVIAVDSEREFGVNILKELVGEFQKRTKMFADKDVADIVAYNALADVERIPSLMLIFDEVQELFNNRDDNADNIARESIECLKTLVTEGRAVGIHIILASSNFRLATGIESIFELMAIRIAIKGTPDQSARTILSDDNNITTILKNESAGAAVYNNANGDSAANTVFQIAYLPKEDRSRLLEKIARYTTATAELTGYKYEQRVLLTHIEDDIYNPLNQLIIKKKVDTLGDNTDSAYPLMVGEALSLNRKFKIALDFRKNNNLLIVSQSEEKAKSLIMLIMASLLHGEISKEGVNKTDRLIYLLDYSDDEESYLNDEINLSDFTDLFEEQIQRILPSDLEESIDAVHKMLRARKERGTPQEEEKLFVIFFGINRAHRMINEEIYEEDIDEKNLTTMDQYKEILCDGNQYGICSIVWGESLNAVKNALGSMVKKNFNKRIVFEAGKDAMEELVNESDSEQLKKNTAIYMDINEIKNKHFRLYETPKTGWIKNYAEAYKSVAQKEECANG